MLGEGGDLNPSFLEKCKLATTTTYLWSHFMCNPNILCDDKTSWSLKRSLRLVDGPCFCSRVVLVNCDCLANLES